MTIEDLNDPTVLNAYRTGVARLKNKKSQQQDLEDLFFNLCLQAGLETPLRQFRFAPPRKFRADFAWLPERVLVEIDGGIYSGGRHVRGSGFRKDCEKGNSAIEYGYVVLHYGTGMVNWEAVAQVKRVLTQRKNSLTIERLPLI